MKQFSNLSKYKIVAMVGLPGSGKSYLSKQIAKEHGYVRLSSDAIRTKKFLTPGENKFYNDNSKYEKNKMAVYEELYAQVVETVKQGKRVIIDATHLGDQRQLLLQFLKEHNLIKEATYLVVKTAQELAEKRIKKISEEIKDQGEHFQRWQSAHSYFLEHLELGKYSYPDETEGLEIIEVRN